MLNKMKGFLRVLICAAAALGLAYAPLRAAEFAVKCPLEESALKKLSDSPDAWREISKLSKVKAFDAVKNGKIEEATSWLYMHYASEFFLNYSPNLPMKFKTLILSNLTSFFDFYESVLPEDYLDKAGIILEELAYNCPREFERHLGLALAVSLVYDAIPPAECTNFGLPDTPSIMDSPQEVLIYAAAASSPFDLNKLAVCELVWIAGMFGPLDELRSLKMDGVRSTYVERFQTLIRTDRARIKKNATLPWDSEIAYTPANIMKYGGLPEDKSYYGFRFAQANLIPAICYMGGSKKSDLWVVYMWKPGVWKSVFGKIPPARVASGKAYNPQTWALLTNSDIERLNRRGFINGVGAESRVLTHISKMAYDEGDLNLSEMCAKRAVASDPLNTSAYNALIAIRARRGASVDEIDGIWRAKINAFKPYPLKYIDVLVERRENLELALKKQESDAFFWNNLRPALRADYEYGMQVYMDELRVIMADNPDNPEAVLPRFCELCRGSWQSMRVDPFTNLVEPIVNELYEAKAIDTAEKALTSYEAIMRRESSIALSRNLRAQRNKLLREADELEREIALEKARKDSEKLTAENKKRARQEAEMSDAADAAAAEVMRSTLLEPLSNPASESGDRFMDNEADDALLNSIE